MMIIGASKVVRIMIVGDVTTWSLILMTLESSFKIVIGHRCVIFQIVVLEWPSRSLRWLLLPKLSRFLPAIGSKQSFQDVQLLIRKLQNQLEKVLCFIYCS